MCNKSNTLKYCHHWEYDQFVDFLLVQCGSL